MWISGPLFAVKTCGGMLSDSKGVFTSPLHPSFYPPAVDCKWTIKVCIPAPFTGPLLYLKPHPSSSSSSILSLPWAECWGSTVAAKLFSTSSIFICQNAVAAAAPAEMWCSVCRFCVCACMHSQPCSSVLLLVFFHLHVIQIDVSMCRWSGDMHRK